MSYLLRVTYSCILMTHGTSDRGGQSETSQSRTRSATAVRSFTGRGRPDGSRLLGFVPSSISISATSTTITAGSACRRHQDSLHDQAFRTVGRTSPLLRRQDRLVAERHCESLFGGFSRAENKAWVIDHKVDTTRFSWNIDLIVCYPPNWNKFTSCWYRTKDGPSPKPIHKRLGRN
jgi:hypothetical protein